MLQKIGRKWTNSGGEILFKYRRRTLPISMENEFERTKAQADANENAANRNAANIDYVAMMTDVEIPEVDENEQEI